jgi:hypothetical protein
MWEIQLTLTDPGSSARIEVPAGRRITGTIVLVPYDWPVNSLRFKSPTHYGLFAIDFTPLGFDPRVAGNVPLAAVDPLPMDSVSIELQPGGADLGSIILLGRASGSTIVGEWGEQLHCCGSSGTFIMRRTAGAGANK